MCAIMRGWVDSVFIEMYKQLVVVCIVLLFRGVRAQPQWWYKLEDETATEKLQFLESSESRRFTTF